MVSVEQPRTVVATPTGEWVTVFISFPILGALAGWLVIVVSGWPAEIPFLPLRRLFEQIQGAPQPAATIVAASLGAALTLTLAILGWTARLAVEVTAAAVTLHRAHRPEVIVRKDVAGAFIDGKHLVLLSPAGRESAREESDLDVDQLRLAFTSHDYRWYADGDPYAADFQRWVEGLPDVPAAAEAFLRARQKAIDGNKQSEMKALRRELSLLGIVVRDDHRQQFWRQAGSAEPRSARAAEHRSAEPDSADPE